ncbi:MAG: amidohydrolase [Candidatus Microthrix parvicella]|jgi:5-methylthioadenosine/S-adenosylhomocysteine deaminase
MSSERVVLTGGTVITCDPTDRVINHGAIAIEGERIVAVGSGAEVAALLPGAVHRPLGGAIVMPGLINAHTHLAMTLFRGLADDVNLEGFLALVMPAEAAVLSSAAVRDGVALAVAESLLGGVTSALDMYFWDEVASEVAHDAGLRLAGGPAFLGGTGPEGNSFDAQVQRARRLWAREPAEGWHTAIGRWAHPHATYTLAPDQLSAVAAAAREVGARIHTHAAESEGEVAMVSEAHGLRPVELLDTLGLLGADVVLAHAVHLDDDEIAAIARSGTSVAHCPGSNLKLGSGVARIPELLDAGVTVGLGTDGPASSNDLDLFATMRLAALIHKGVSGDASVMTAHQVLRAATIGGATLLGAGDELGSIEQGKLADLVVLDPGAPHLTPTYDPVGTVVYAAGRGDVTDVWVGGRRVVADRALLTMDVAPARAAVSARRPEVLAAIR